jgi:hypothetical protein
MRFVSRQKRDEHFIKKFRSTFPTPDKAVIIWGDAFKQEKNYRGHLPTDSAEYFKKLLLRGGYKIFEVDEYMTSKKCHACEHALNYA